MRASLFPLGEAYEVGKDLASNISSQLRGRLAGHPHDYGILAQMIRHAGPGDYVEIGSLFGGSAILAALVKRHYDDPGRVVCIDPMDGYYGSGMKDAQSQLVPSPRIFWENMEAFGVQKKVELHSHKSQPWPLPSNGYFTSAFIDGWHWGDVPWEDFIALSQVVDPYILFDNYDNEHLSVVQAVTEAARGSWTLVHLSGISAVLQKEVAIIDKHAARMERRMT